MNKGKIVHLLFAMAVATVLSGVVQAEPRYTYYYSDASGSPVVTTDEHGNVLWRKTYRPFGESDQDDFLNGTSFTGHQADDETGLVYMQERYYHPRYARFLSPDPVTFNEGNPMSLNAYIYANQNPYKYVDPDGRASVLLGVEGNVTVGGGINAATGVLLTTGGDTGPPDAGVFASGGGSLGGAASANAFVTFLKGGRENIDGVLDTVSLSVAGFDVELHREENGGDFLGVTVGAGPGAGLTFDKVGTTSATLQDAVSAVKDVYNNFKEKVSSYSNNVKENKE